MEVSVGVIAYNEEKNIGKLLDSLNNQKLQNISLKEIIVVSSGSTDRTNQIIKDFEKKNNKIKLIIQEKREGKVSAINEFLKLAKCNILVQISGDLILANTTMEDVCKPLFNSSVGIVGGHPVPINKMNSLVGFIVNFQWQLHHEICLLSPKFGEIIAFRKEFKQIPNNAVDEEYIASVIKKRGLKFVYAQNAIVYNKGPEKFTDFIKQRRRIYAGHLKLCKQRKYAASTMHYNLLVKALLKTIPRNAKYFMWIIAAILAESYGRLLGIYDFYVKKDKHVVWEIAESAKFN